jgi:hypothetical protein
LESGKERERECVCVARKSNQQSNEKFHFELNYSTTNNNIIVQLTKMLNGTTKTKELEQY